jgi:putative ABC transport system substrate-binding protein
LNGPLKEKVANSTNLEDVEIKVFVTGGIENYNVASQLEGIRRYEPDALLSIGVTCSFAAKAFFHKEDNSLPIIFIGVSDPIKDGLVHHAEKPMGNITGISVEAPADELPIQALIKLRPSIKRFVFVYSENAFEGKVAFEISQMSKYVKSTNRRTLCIPFTDADNLKKVLSEEMQNNDGIVVPKSSLTPRDLEKIDDVCNAKNAFLFAQADGFMPKSAICGYSGDIEFIGL